MGSAAEAQILESGFAASRSWVDVIDLQMRLRWAPSVRFGISERALFFVPFEHRSFR